MPHYLDATKRTIGQVVYEDNDVQKICRAFARGCAGVIIDAPLPKDVQLEINSLDEASVLAAKNNEDQKLFLTCNGPTAKDWTWDNDLRSQDLAQNLSKTKQWLEDKLRWATASSLHNIFTDAAQPDREMTLWLAGFHTPWHIDTPDLGKGYDIHIHMRGEGMVVASTNTPQEVSFLAQGIYRKASHEGNIDQIDQGLIAKGFNLIALQPGQMLIFNQTCLHRSSSYARDQIKLRAGIF